MPQTDVTQPYFFEHFKLADDLRVHVEKRQCVAHRHVKHIGNRLAFVLDFQCFTVVALAVTDWAVNVNRRQKAHFKLDASFTFAGLARTALCIKAKSPRPIASLERCRCSRKYFAKRQHEPGVGCRVRARRFADRALVDLNNLVEIIGSFDFFKIQWLQFGAMQSLFHVPTQRFVNQCRLTRPRHARDRHQSADRKTARNVLEIAP